MLVGGGGEVALDEFACPGSVDGGAHGRFHRAMGGGIGKQLDGRRAHTERLEAGEHCGDGRGGRERVDAREQAGGPGREVRHRGGQRCGIAEGIDSGGKGVAGLPINLAKGAGGRRLVPVFRVAIGEEALEPPPGGIEARADEAER